MTAVTLNAVSNARTAFVRHSEFGSVASEIRQHGSPVFRTSWAALVIIGVIGGVLSGLFAIGGAIVMVAQSNDLILQLRKRAVSKVIRLACSQTCA